MKIPYNWLKTYVNTKASVKDLSALLTMAGLEITSIDSVANDTVMELEITSNRPDWLSVTGIAREVAAITGAKLIMPDLKLKNKPQKGSAFKVEVNDAKLCPRYTARIITNVNVSQSPQWLIGRIEAMGLRPVNNIVDITNFCLFELGFPMHAFDFDKLHGAKIIVRCAKIGESIVTIDNIKRDLNENILVIADEKNPVAIAGVMGGLDTEVTFNTKNVLLEVACFDPIAIRHASRKLGLASESSYRFERKVDINNIALASNRAANLIAEIAKGQICGFSDIYKNKYKAKTISYSPGYSNNVLGIDIPITKQASILKSLGCKVTKSKGKALKVTVPSWRNDLENPIDLTEEVARIYGYSKIPETLPSIKANPDSPKDRDLIIRDYIKDLLAGCGLQEAITYTLIGDANFARIQAEKPVIEIRNPLTQEQRFMRPDILAGILKVVSNNINHRNLNIKLFELGNIYTHDASFMPQEEIRLCIALSGNRTEDWQMHKKEVDFYYLKGIAAGLFKKLQIKEYDFIDSENNIFVKEAQGAITIKNEYVGVMGKISPDILARLDIKQAVFCLEINISKILPDIVLKANFEPIARFPQATRDIALLVKSQVKSRDIINLIYSSGKGLVKEVVLFDEYHGEQIPAGYKSLAYSIVYQNIERTLIDTEVLNTHQEICRKIIEKLGAQIR